VVLGLTAAYMLAEAIGGYFTHSLALLADSGHMLSDVAALGLSVFAIWIGRRPATPQHSYGYYRVEILAAAANAATLIAISIFVFVEAFRRLSAPPDVQGFVVMGIAGGGFLMNVVGMFVLSGGRRENLNVRGAWLHLATDALGNIGTVAAGFAVSVLAWRWADPVASILIGVLVIYSAWSLLRESVSVLMEGTPAGIDPETVRATMLTVPGVQSIHDLHIWAITSGMSALSAHVDVDESRTDREVLPELCGVLRQRFGIEHPTLQLEHGCVSPDHSHA
jgi:cobalt-zinc-cadmium efflux system protein